MTATIENPPAIKSSELNDVGIGTKLTQNDLVEVVVAEKYQEFLREVNHLRLKKEELFNKKREILKSLIDRARLDFRKRIRKPLNEVKGRVMETHELYGSKKPDSGEILVNFPQLYPGYTRKEPTVLQSAGEYLRVGDVVIGTTFEESESSGGVTRAVKLSRKYEYSNPFKSLEQEITEHNEKVEKLVERHKGKNMDQAALEKEIRVAINKNIIKSQAPEIKAKIDQLFGTNL